LVGLQTRLRRQGHLTAVFRGNRPPRTQQVYEKTVACCHTVTISHIKMRRLFGKKPNFRRRSLFPINEGLFRSIDCCSCLPLCRLCLPLQVLSAFIVTMLGNQHTAFFAGALGLATSSASPSPPYSELLRLSMGLDITMSHSTARVLTTFRSSSSSAFCC
jgi:hypothetical protein